MARCDGCTFYEPSIINSITDKTQGGCRRNPPMMMAVAGGFQTSFPIVRNDMWCGEHAVHGFDYAVGIDDLKHDPAWAGRTDHGEQ